MDLNFSNFSYDDDDEERETQLSVLEDEELVILNKMKNLIDDTAKDVKLKLTDEVEKKFMILSRYISNMLELASMCNSDSISDDEKLSFIKTIDESIQDIGYETALNYDIVDNEETLDNDLNKALLNLENQSSSDDDEDDGYDF